MKWLLIFKDNSLTLSFSLARKGPLDKKSLMGVERVQGYNKSDCLGILKQSHDQSDFADVVQGRGQEAVSSTPCEIEGSRLQPGLPCASSVESQENR